MYATTNHMPDLLRRKAEKRGTITISVPSNYKKRWHVLVELADKYEFDLTGPISEALQALIKKAEGEIERHVQRNGNGTSADSH